ncbi:hypothetical protein A9P82_08730 [Arachidicoccus ginsenosidimutans]|uniref:tRNA1(Val) (adenine(37)-N6)-methyltransferase n=1 Tax=Arachidicoccus sp. BS20 TaxID=1850526 RepID=UPI0007F1143F|nr:methyltransferase [Arachidicoccus sp. BS20]ANI89368.1 hypothetical protein A9P82_08730 [Arachidicoccus sp. BS20]
MAQTYFQFKQFKIEQDKTAMKVCTDACLFGALITENETVIKDDTVLDIGAGTGLLSLMIAQKNTAAKIDAVEIDKDAFEQARENISHSIWKNVEVHHQPIQEFTKDRNACYDLIVSNPPFFENDLKSINEQRNKALHSSDLSLKELVEIVNKLLAEKGTFCVLLPFSRTEYFVNLAEKENLFLQKKILVKQTPKHHFFRSILFFKKENSGYETEEIVIKENDVYSLRFTELLKDYYLYL